MEEGGLALLRAWDSFYVIVGPSAAVLIGLQFVVIVLSAEINVLGDDGTVSAFSTPTIIHFCEVLLVSALISAPWSGLFVPAVALGLCGIAGLCYAALVVRRTRRQTLYTPVLEDWIWHCILPLVAYAALVIVALMLPRWPTPALFGISALMLLLLFIGLHNAWDAVVYMALRQRRE